MRTNFAWKSTQKFCNGPLALGTQLVKFGINLMAFLRFPNSRMLQVDLGAGTVLSYSQFIEERFSESLVSKKRVLLLNVLKKKPTKDRHTAQLGIRIYFKCEKNANKSAKNFYDGWYIYDVVWNIFHHIAKFVEPG